MSHQRSKILTSCDQSEEIDKIGTGTHLNIQRSDGRIHGAMVTQVNRDTRMVSVEWFEKGETKGKEIEFKAIKKVNPEFFRTNIQQSSNSSNKNVKKAIADNVQDQSFGPNQTAAKHDPNVTFPVAMLEQAEGPKLEIREQNYDKINIGMHVNIERSDGRVHGAVVTQINPENRMVSVEWFEKGETRGKEIDMKIIKRVNPEIFPPSNPIALPTSGSKKLSSGGSQTARNISTSSKIQNQHLTNFKMEQLSSSYSAAATIPMDTTNNADEFDEHYNSRRRTHQISKRADSAGQIKKAGKLKMPELGDIKENEDFLLEDTKLSPEFPINDIKENEPMLLPSASALQSNITTRKSQLLSNIEELERNREHRRTQQGNARKQREMKMQIDPGNSNWEFLAMIRDYQAQLVYRPLRSTDPVVDNRICVCVRKRPLGKKEMMNKEVEVVTIPSKNHVIVHQPQVKVDLTKYLVNQKFRFDYAFNENTDNELVYKFSAQPLVRTIFQRGFATCFAYGQTGSGKTHTMGGIIEGRVQDCANGVYAMTATDVFAYLHSPAYRNEGLSVSCSFFEIYGSKVFDLLSRRAVLRVLEDGKKLVQVVGLKEIKVQNVEDVLKLIKIGSDQRTAGQTSANSNSSRSHAVFQIILRKREKPSEIHGKFSLIDLAGNERGADTISSDRQTRLEGGEINKSLLALKECIRAMGRDEQHIPFRGSKLTLILRDSFVGRNAKTCMIAMISPGISCVENTMNTLRYADRVKELGNEFDEQDEMAADDFIG